MKELLHFEGQLFNDLTPIVNGLVAQARAKGESSRVEIYLDDDRASLLVKLDSLETRFHLPRSIESRAMGIIEMGSSGSNRVDGRCWSYSKDSDEKGKEVVT